MRLSAKQRQIVSYGGNGKRWTLVSGPMGSGKTFAGGAGFGLFTSLWGHVEFGICTKSWGQLKSFIRESLEPAIAQEVMIEDDGSFEISGANGFSNRIRCFAAQDKRVEPRMRSYNFAGMLFDEMTTLPSGVLAAGNARCRVGEAKIIGLTNPDGPRHPVKLNYFDNAEGIDAEVIQTSLYDNPSLSHSYIDSLSAHYSGHMRERMVHGRWAAATGLVFPRAIEFSEDSCDPATIVAHDVVIDVGEASVTCALLCGRTATGKSWILDEWVHDHSTQGRLSERDLVSRIRHAWPGVVIGSWIVDPAALRFRQELLRQLPKGSAVGKAYNDWDEGVWETNHWFASEALYIDGDKCPETMATIGALVYDEDQAAIGKDVPVKVPDHLTDCLRYYTLTRAIHESGGREAWEANRKQMRETQR